MGLLSVRLTKGDGTMRVMLTGGSGFVGSHTCKALLDGGHDVRMLVRNVDKTKRVLAALGVEPPSLIVGDITDRRSVDEALRGCHAAIHSAAVVAIDGDDKRMIDANVRGTETVLNAAVDYGCDPVVHVSSSSALFPFQTDPVTADHPIGSMDGGYGRSKAEAEAIARDLQGAGAPITIVYPTGILGPDAPEINETLQGAQYWLKTVPDSTEMRIGIVDVRDVAAILTACLQPGAGWRRYLAWGDVVDMHELGLIVRQITGRNIGMPAIPRIGMKAWGVAGDVARRFGRDLTLTSEGCDYLFDFNDGDQSAMLNELGITLRPIAETLADSYRWMHQEGYVTADQVGMLAA